MDTEKRIRLIRILGKIESNPGFSEKLGIRDKSEFKTGKPEGGRKEKCYR